MVSWAGLPSGAGNSGAAGFSGAPAAMTPLWLAAGSSRPRTGIPTAAGSSLVMGRFHLIVVGKTSVS